MKGDKMGVGSKLVALGAPLFIFFAKARLSVERNETIGHLIIIDLEIKTEQSGTNPTHKQPDKTYSDQRVTAYLTCFSPYFKLLFFMR
jgi:hypothetical protein